MHRAYILGIGLALAACASPAPSAQKPGTAPAPVEAVRPLANLASQRIIVAPAFGFQQDDPMGWTAGIPRPRGALRALDSAIVAEFSARGLAGTWYFAPDLERSYQLNSTYAANPYNLAESPLRGRLEIGKNYGEPLSSQLRTMIAMQDGARRVILPVNLGFERAENGEGRAVIRLVMVDARTTEYLWVYELKSDPAPAFSAAMLKSLASHFADLVVSP